MQKQIFVLPTKHQSAAGFVTIWPNFNWRQFAHITILLPSVCQWESAHNSLQMKNPLCGFTNKQEMWPDPTEPYFTHHGACVSVFPAGFPLIWQVWFLFPENVSRIRWWSCRPQRSVHAYTHAAHSATPASWVQQRSQLRFWLVHLYSNQWE